jgi:predicted HicB family RNase H-like nuclease
MPGREDDDRRQATLFRLDPQVHKQLRIAAIEDGISMNDALTQAVHLWLKERKAKRSGKRGAR